MEKSLQKANSTEISIPDERLSSVNMNALLEAAVKQGSAMEVIKELRAMEADIQQRRSEAAFNESLSAFQSECPVIIKGKAVRNDSNKELYSYAPIEKIEEVIRPICRKHGFTHTYDTDVTSEKGFVIAKCIVTHNQGHNRTTSLKLPLGSRTSIMSESQVVAGALTFANRRALANAYGLVIAGEDRDGSNPPKTSTSGRVVTSEIRIKFFEISKPWHKQLRIYADAMGWLMPNEDLDKLADEHIPTTKGELAKLQVAVESHK